MKIQNVIKLMQCRWFINAPVEEFDAIDNIEKYIGVPLPADYKYFLQWFSNGGEGKLPVGYLLMFPCEEILDRHKDYRLDETIPNSLIFALEGDDVFCFDLSSNRSIANYNIFRISLCSLDPDEIEIVGENFVSFLSRWLQVDDIGTLP